MNMNEGLSFLRSSREKPREHLPVALVIDKSYSMGLIQDVLNQCIRQLIARMKQDPIFRNVVELLVVHYNRDLEVKAEFLPLLQTDADMLDIRDCNGNTDTGKALLYALDRLEQRQKKWKSDVQHHYQPLCVLLTDGYPEAGLHAPADYRRSVEADYAAAARRIRQMEQDKKLTFIAAGIQQKDARFRADMERLRELTNYPNRAIPIGEELANLKHFDEFFVLVEKTTSAMFEGTPPELIDQAFWEIGKM